MSLARATVLGGKKPDRLQLMVPKGYEKPAFFCRVPGCETTFYANEQKAYERHVGKCAREHMDRIMELSENRARGPFNEANWDPEVAEHLLGVGERMIEEGRLEVKPHERAGLS